MAVTSITVSYCGEEKRIPLSVIPSLELSDDQVIRAELELHEQLRTVFQVPSDVLFYLHEAESSRVMSRETLREYSKSFPSHWYLVNSREGRDEVVATSNGLLPAVMSDDDLMTGLTTPPSDNSSETDNETEPDDDDMPQLADLTALSEESYSTVTVVADKKGSFGLSLRHFTIQSDSNQRPDTPLEDFDRSNSRLSTDSLELKLSTTFILRVTKGGCGEGAGLEVGHMVHMINGVKIISSSVQDIQRLVGQCDHEVTLLTLPKEHDDLQFLYPRYTYGPSGEYSTKDGQVTATDIKVVCGKGSKVSPAPGHVIPPPSGMMVFNDTDYASQDNSQSCDPRQVSHDDVLVEGSLLDIETHSHAPTRQGGVVKRAPEPTNTSTEPRPPPNTIPSEWYNDNFSLGQEDVSVSNQIVLDTSTSDSNFLSSVRPLTVKVRTRSNSSLETRPNMFGSQGTSSPSDSLSSRAPLTSSMSALDTLGRNQGNYKDRARSTDLGRVKIKKKGNKSLEGLTRIASDSLQKRISIRPLKEVKSKAPTMSQTSRTSIESSSSIQAPESVETAPSKRSSSRSYQKKRRELHSRSRSKVAVGEPESMDNDVGGYGGQRSQSTYQSQRSLSTSQETEIPSSSLSFKAVSDNLTSDPATPTILVEPRQQAWSDPKAALLPRQHALSDPKAAPLLRQAVRETPSSRPRINRPMSAVEHVRVSGSNLQVPFSTEQPQQKKIALYKTRSIGDQVFREVNIEEAIAVSQTESSSQGDRWRVGVGVRSQSIDISSQSLDTNKKKSKRLFGRKQNSVDLLDAAVEISRPVAMSSALHRLSTEMLSTIGISIPTNTQPEYTQTNIQCHGVLTKKQDLLDSGKRANDRNWRSYYAVLASNQISFYRDRREARLRTPSDELSIDVVPSKTDYLAYKKKFVFKVVTDHGAVYLLQASDAPSLEKWVRTIQELNGGPPTPPPSDGGPLSRSTEGKLGPPSPSQHRRAHSPVKSRRKEDGHSGSRGLLDKIKYRVQKRRKDEPDFSSFITFGQPLEDCPVSLDNKRVPLVVEYCVRVIQEQGLNVEGIYRVPGHASMIKHLSSEMDKGVYEFTQEEIGDVQTVASLFKKFLKELPDPMIPEAVHDDFIACARLADESDRLTRLHELVYNLPTAHYHTLKFIMLHLTMVAGQSDLNKMSFRNVALVFGPTLVRGAAQDMLTSMNESYIIVEALCRHVEHLFASDLCAEEFRAETEGGVVSEGEEGVVRGSPALKHKEIDHQHQKDAALASASPQSLRRIKNNLSGGETFQIRSTEPNRNSLIAINGSLPPKQSNWETSGGVQLRVANQSVDSGVSSPGDHQRSPDGEQTSRPRRSRHTYEDVEQRSRPPVRHNYEEIEILTAPRVTNSRTSNWVNTHSEIGWGKREGQREGTGSMWAPQNRARRPHRQESFDERERDLTRTYNAPTTNSRSYSQRQRTSNTLPTPSSPGVKRRISYVSAMGGPPTDSPNDRFTSSTRYSQSSTQHRTPRGFDSLQRPISTASSTRRPRRGSESSSDRADIERFEEAKAMLLRAAPTMEPPVHRTHSHGPAPHRDRVHPGGEGLVRTGSGRPGGEGLVRTGSGRQVRGQSYVKQSLL